MSTKSWTLVGVLVLLGVAFALFAIGLWGYRLDTEPLGRWANIAQVLQGVVGLLTLAPVLWAVIRYRRAAEDQRKAKHYQAWQAISIAQGKSGSGGRRTALEDLHRDGVSLVGVELTGGEHGGAFLAGLELPAADLAQANFRGANLWGAHLRGANFHQTVLDRAKLGEADLSEATLFRARLMGADLTRADLRNASLVEAQLQRVDLSDAMLEGSRLTGSQLQEACLLGTHLSGANLAGANLHRADLSTALGVTREQLQAAGNWTGAKLPADLKDLERPSI